MHRNELPLKPCHQGVPSGASNLRLWYVRCKPCSYLAQTITLSLYGLQRDFTWLTSPRSSIGCVQNDFWAYGMFGANHATILHQDYHYLQTQRNELPVEPHNRGVPSGASKMIFESIVCLAQTMHLSCTDTNTVSKQTKIGFHTTHIT
jgi:hypothetical protein